MAGNLHTQLRRLESELAKLVDSSTSEEYHRKRADLYASVLAFFQVHRTRDHVVQLCRLALTAESYNPEYKNLVSLTKPRTSVDQPNSSGTS